MDGSLGIFALVCLSVVTGKSWRLVLHRGGSRISGKGGGGHMYKGVGIRFADFISFFFNIPRK